MPNWWTHPNCNYFAEEDTVCNKCGQLVRKPTPPGAEAGEVEAMSAEEIERERQIQAEVIQPDRMRLRLLATLDAKDREIERLKAELFEWETDPPVEYSFDDQLMAERDSARAWARRWKAAAGAYKRLLDDAATTSVVAEKGRAVIAEAMSKFDRTQLTTLREAVGPLVEALETIKKSDSTLGWPPTLATKALAAFRKATEGKNG